MVEKVGRNDPCPCGSGKKYKSCCFLKDQQSKKPLGSRKFTAKVISGGGMNKVTGPAQEQTKQQKPMVDYTTLMERSFGSALHSHEEKPPVPSNPSEYFVGDNPEQE